MTITTEFIDAIRDEDLDTVRELVEEKKVDVTVNNNEAVILASRKGFLDILKYLEIKGANLKARNEEALVEACKMKNLKVVKYLFSKGFSFNRGAEALSAACERKYSEIKLYLEKKQLELQGTESSQEDDLQAEEVLLTSVRFGKCDVVKMLLDRGYLNINNQDAVLDAVKQISSEKVRREMIKIVRMYVM